MLIVTHWFHYGCLYWTAWVDLALNNKSRDIVFCIASFLYSKSNQNYISWSAPKRLFCYHLNNLRFCGRDSNTKTAACERYVLPEKTSRWLITPWVLFYELTSKYGDLNNFWNWFYRKNRPFARSDVTSGRRSIGDKSYIRVIAP